MFPNNRLGIVSRDQLEAVALLAPAAHNGHAPARTINVPPAARSGGQGRGGGSAPTIDAVEQARRYLAKVPGAMSGEGGHGRTFYVACRLMIDFGLSREEAWPLYQEWNQTCSPPWTDAELEHKLADAEKEPGERGRKLRRYQQQESATLRPGDRVYAKDRENWGHVVEDQGGTAAIRFESPDGRTAVVTLAKNLLTRDDGTEVDKTATGYKVEVIDSAAFHATNYRQHYHCKQVLVAGQPCLLGGMHKCCKTTIAIDLAVSLGTATPFLGRFDCPERVNTMILSGESGGFTLQETARRICFARQVDLPEAAVLWGFRLPQIAKADHLFALETAIEDNAVEVVMIDPAYLCLLSGDTQGRQASNLFDMGSLLMGLGEVGQRTHCTIILIHHFRKNPMEPYAIPSLEELAYSGFAEFARQWILLGRRKAYEPGSGHHALWLNVGGSAGHSGTWALDAEEGVPNEWFQGRKWQVAIQAAVDASIKATAERERRKEEGHQTDILRALDQYPEGETATVIKEHAGLNSKNFRKAIKALMELRKVETVEITKRNGKNEGFRLIRFDIPSIAERVSESADTPESESQPLF